MYVLGARVTGPLGSPTTDGSYVRARCGGGARLCPEPCQSDGRDHMEVDLTLLLTTSCRAVIGKDAPPA